MGGGHPDEISTTDDTETESFKAFKCSQSLVISGGTFTVSSTDDALHANGDVTVNGGTFTIQTGDDGIHADGTVKITAGTITIKNSYEAIEGKNITVEGGKISMTASDDGFNVNDASGVLTINGGEVYIDADGDGMDSNGTIKMTGGTVYMDGPTNDGNGPIDYDKDFSITGGTLIAAGSSGMAQSPESGTHASILMYFTSSQAAQSTVTLKDSSGNVIATYTPSKQYASIVISTPKLKTGTTYTVYKNNTKVVSFTPSDTTTYVNESGITTKQGMGGRQGGGMGQKFR
ncbi:hypothetical protein SDC9_118155 [bioreactor metagenome]|uniref:Carbohydrate-binding domain-containing protein n=1 Tax=bioreactor metagenome TaxID=1076179 RepID=A0A645C0R1_9ZZZZ